MGKSGADYAAYWLRNRGFGTIKGTDNDGERPKMTIRNWLFLFFTTLSLGGVAAPLLGWLLELPFGDMGLTLPQLLLAGLMFGAVAQMGFFAYLIFNWVAMGFFRKASWFKTVQILLLLLVLGEVIIFGYMADTEGRILVPEAVVALVILLAGLLVAFWKVKLTTKRGFVPTLFFMVVATLIESGTALKQESLMMMLFTVLTLLVCNAWQVLWLHRLVVPPTPEGGKNRPKKRVGAPVTGSKK
jgi:KinB signaling pathway activation protein